MDTILEVKKLNAAQQLNTMIIPSSAVNMMWNEDDCWFQCQEPGHIAWHCPHIRCYECDENGHILMDYPHKIHPSRTPATHHKAQKGHHARSSLRQHWEDQERQNWSRSQSNCERHCSSSHCNLHRGNSRSQHWDRHGHLRSSSWWSHSAHRGHSHRPHHNTLYWSHCRSSTYCSSSGYKFWDHSTSHSWWSYWCSMHEWCRLDSHPSRTGRRLHPKKNMKVKKENLYIDYYSSDDTPVIQERNQIL